MRKKNIIQELMPILNGKIVKDMMGQKLNSFGLF